MADMKKAVAVLAAALLLAGCDNGTASGIADEKEEILDQDIDDILEDEDTDDSDIYYDDDIEDVLSDDVPEEMVLDDIPDDFDEADLDDMGIEIVMSGDGEYNVDAADDSSAESALISRLQTNGQTIYSDEYCQIRYFGDTKDDDGNLVYVLGYKKFHGGLVRFTHMGIWQGSATDGSQLRLSSMNKLTDGYLCHSGAHGEEYYYDDPDGIWWQDNEYIYLSRTSAWEQDYPGNYGKYFGEKVEYDKYDDSVYDGVSTLELYIHDITIEEASGGNQEGDPPRFDEPSGENTHVCRIDLSVPVIRVRFDPEQADFWAHT